MSWLFVPRTFQSIKDEEGDLAYDVGFMLTSVSSGGIAGFLIGYAIKKGIKIILGIAGLFLGALAYLNYKGLVTVDWEKIASASNKAISEFSLGSANYASSVMDSQVVPTMMNFGVPLTGSFAAGFILGCLKG
ncbi:MAG: FUN14 domain-containing protein [Thermoproteota archaeon]|nr:FUN14 domain-containing protein [Thermoproteota archaeon]